MPHPLHPHQPYLSIIPSLQPITIPLPGNPPPSKHQDPPKAQQPPVDTANNPTTTQYISSLLIIDPDTICTVSEKRLGFYSICGDNKSRNEDKKEMEIDLKENDLKEKEQKSGVVDYQHQKSRFIGEVTLQKDLKNLFWKGYAYEEYMRIMMKMNEGQNYDFNQEEYKVTPTTYPKQSDLRCFQQSLKPIDFTHPSITQYKGVIYDPSTRQFFLLINTLKNKYLISFTLSITSPPSYQQPFSSSLHLANFSLLYNFQHPPQPIKYDLQMAPQLLYLEGSRTLGLVRKFYSDSLVVVFVVGKEGEEEGEKKKGEEEGLIMRRESSGDSFNSGVKKDISNNRNNSKAMNNNNNIFQFDSDNHDKADNNNNNPNPFHPNPCPSHTLHWQFYINQQCLSPLDPSHLLINYRQLITKHCAQLDIIDILTKHKTTIKLTQAIEPMTIINISLLPMGSSFSQNKGKGNKGGKYDDGREEMVIRIFGVLKYRQASCVVDVEVGEQVVRGRWVWEGVVVERVGGFVGRGRGGRVNNQFNGLMMGNNYQYQHYQQHKQQQDANDDYYYYCLVNYLHTNANLIGVLPLHLPPPQQQPKDSCQQFIKNLISTSTPTQTFTWSAYHSTIISYQQSLRPHHHLTMNKSQVIHKGYNYLSMMERLREREGVLRDGGFVGVVWGVLMGVGMG